MFGNTGGMSGMGAGQQALLQELMRGRGGPINGMGQAQTAPLVEQQAQGNDLSSVVGKLGNMAAGAYLMNKGNGMKKMANEGAFPGPTQSGGNLNEAMLRQADMLKHMGMGYLR